MTLHGLKKLEALAESSAKKLRQLAEDNARLAKDAAKLEAENKSLKEQVKRLAAGASAQARLRARLLKISRKLEKIG
ncbi:MAG TPA: hypothetical protein VNK24_04360 [Elusimicrobiota bacterium]|nr:hypothetical protein [Elusimicrobiota bacterium]